MVTLDLKPGELLEHPKAKGTNVKEYYVYILLDPRKPGKYEYLGLDIGFLFEPFYVGKGKGKRVTNHFLPCELKRNTPKVNRIKKIMKNINDYPFALKICDFISKEEANNLEMKLIKLIGRKDLGKGPLVNLTDGGDGGNGYVPSLQLREYFSRIRKGVSHPSPSQETRHKISISLTGRRANFSEKDRKRRSERMIQYNKNRISHWKGEGNPNYGKGIGFDNPRAYQSFLVLDNEGKIYFVEKGTLRLFSEKMNLGEGKALRTCAWKFLKTGVLQPVKSEKCKGWSAVFLNNHISNNPLDEQWAISSRVSFNKEKGSTVIPNGSTHKCGEAPGIHKFVDYDMTCST